MSFISPPSNLYKAFSCPGVVWQLIPKTNATHKHVHKNILSKNCTFVCIYTWLINVGANSISPLQVLTLRFQFVGIKLF